MARVVRIDSIIDGEKYIVNYSVIDKSIGLNLPKQLEFSNKADFKKWITTPIYQGDDYLLSLLVNSWLAQDNQLSDSALINAKTLSIDKTALTIDKAPVAVDPIIDEEKP